MNYHKKSWGKRGKSFPAFLRIDPCVGAGQGGKGGGAAGGGERAGSGLCLPPTSQGPRLPALLGDTIAQPSRRQRSRAGRAHT